MDFQQQQIDLDIPTTVQQENIQDFYRAHFNLTNYRDISSQNSAILFPYYIGFPNHQLSQLRVLLIALKKIIIPSQEQRSIRLGLCQIDVEQKKCQYYLKFINETYNQLIDHGKRIQFIKNYTIYQRLIASKFPQIFQKSDSKSRFKLLAQGLKAQYVEQEGKVYIKQGDQKYEISINDQEIRLMLRAEDIKNENSVSQQVQVYQAKYRQKQDFFFIGQNQLENQSLQVVKQESSNLKQVLAKEKNQQTQIQIYEIQTSALQEALKMIKGAVQKLQKNQSVHQIHQIKNILSILQSMLILNSIEFE